MNTPSPPDHEFERRIASRLLDVLIRAGLISVLAVLCYKVFAPFLTLMAWAIILAVTIYPLQQSLARRIGGKQGLAATIVVIGCGLLIIAPTALLMDSFGSSIHDFVSAVQRNTLEIPAPREGVKGWPVVGERIYDMWSWAHVDLPGLVQSMQPKIGELARKALSIVAGIGFGLLQFLASFIIAGIVMAYGEAGARGSRAIFERIVGPERGERFARLSTATIRSVAQGVIGIAFVQAILVGLALLVAPRAVGRRVGGRHARAEHCPSAGVGRHPSGDRLHLVEWQLRPRRGHHVHDSAVALGDGRQCVETTDVGPRRRCADAGDPVRRAGRHGGRRNRRDVRGRDAAGARLPDIHGLGR